MQPNKSKIAMIIGVMYLGVSGASFAASESFTITATTIDDLTLSEDVALDFGSNIFTTAGTCTMDADTPGDALLQTNGTATAAQANFGDLSGDGCVNGLALGTPGVYTATASVGTDISITLNNVTAVSGDYTFEPVGVAGNYDNTATADSDTAVAIDTSAAVTVTTPSALDDDALVVQNELVFVLGGTLSVLNPLTADQIVADVFTVSVVY
jgi:hypothetical protein